MRILNHEATKTDFRRELRRDVLRLIVWSVSAGLATVALTWAGLNLKCPTIAIALLWTLLVLLLMPGIVATVSNFRTYRRIYVPKRRRFTFGLPTVLIGMVALGFVLTPVTIRLNNLRKEKPAVAQVLKSGGDVDYDMLGSVWRVDFHLRTVTHLPSLKGLPKLRVVHLNGSRVRDLSPIAELTSLRRLYLYATPVRDLTPLHGLTHLRRLVLGETSVTNEEVARLQKALPNCKIIR